MRNKQQAEDERLVSLCEDLTRATLESELKWRAGLLAVSAKLRTLRESEKVKLSDLADAMDISTPYLSDLERGRRDLNTALLKSYLAHLRALSKP